MLENVHDHGQPASEEHPERPFELRIAVLKVAPIQVTKDKENSCDIAEERQKRKPAKQSVEASADSHHCKRCDDGENKNGPLKFIHGSSPHNLF